MEVQRFTVHPHKPRLRARATWWVRDRLDPNWPTGPYATREEATAAIPSQPEGQSQ